jgi:RimJ/RimL family protein N-acetyltransferase
MNTERLTIQPLVPNDQRFILELLNSAGWIQFIGDRHVHTVEEASAYVQKIIENVHIRYWVVRLKAGDEPIGIITLIKREYLTHHDVGFAFLPRFTNKGFALEATSAVLSEVAKSPEHNHLYAITVPSNTRSVRLLKKIGFEFEKEIEVEKETLQLHGVSSDKLSIHEITHLFYSVFSNTNNNPPRLDILESLCIPEVLIINRSGNKTDVYNLSSFIEPRRKILTDGTLMEFEEKELSENTLITNSIAQRSSTYQKKGIKLGETFKQEGQKLFQFVRTDRGWKISSVIWQDKN